MGNFEIKKATNGKHYFNLVADNYQVILTSQMYSSKPVCFNGIESVRVNCTKDSRYERKQSVNDKHYFVLKASNGLIVGNSEMYASKAGMENGIESVKRNGTNKTVVEE
jgi:uncharacterized protein YegP (UPF0339 family)